MIRKVASWTFMIAGGPYIVLLSAQGIEWLASGTPVNVHIPLLIASLISFSVGIALKGEPKPKTNIGAKHAK